MSNRQEIVAETILDYPTECERSIIDGLSYHSDLRNATARQENWYVRSVKENFRR